MNIGAIAGNNIDEVIGLVDIMLLVHPVASQLHSFKEKAVERMSVASTKVEYYIKTNGEAILENTLKQLNTG